MAAPPGTVGSVAVKFPEVEAEEEEERAGWSGTGTAAGLVMTRTLGFCVSRKRGDAFPSAAVFMVLDGEWVRRAGRDSDVPPKAPTEKTLLAKGAPGEAFS